MNKSIEIRGLTYGFNPEEPVLKDIHLSVPRGSIYGFLGVNGAGKSTTMRLIMGLLPDPTDSVRVFGSPVSEVYPEALGRIGCLIDYPVFYDHLSGEDNLRIICMIRDIASPRIKETLETVGLSDAGHTKVRQYSLGMKQRLAIGMALISDPELLVLDEPVNGMDPNGMKEIRELLVRLNQDKGITILISSHLLQEVDKMVTHLGIISNGEMVYEGTRQELVERFQYQNIVFHMDRATEFLSQIPQTYQPELRSSTEISVLATTSTEISSLNRQLVEAGAGVYRIHPVGGLEDWFMEITRNTK